MHGDLDRFSSSDGFLSSLAATMKESEGRSVGDPAARVRSGGDPLFTHPHERSCGSIMDAERFLFFCCFRYIFVCCFSCILFFVKKRKERKRGNK